MPPLRPNTAASRRRRFIVLAAYASLWAIACQRAEAPRPTLSIGLLPTRTSEFEASGRAVVNAAQLAVDHANERGLDIDGVALTAELVIVEAPPQPEVALRAARQLINGDQVSAIIGPNLSAIAIPVAGAADGSGVPMVSPGASHPDVTRGRPSVFRVAAVDRVQGRAMARFAREELDATRAAVLFDRAADYNRDMAEAFREAFEVHGGRLTQFESYVTGETDFAAQLEAIRLARADVVYLPNYPADIRSQLRQMQAMGIEAVALGPGSWSLASFDQDAELFEGHFHSSNWNHDVDGERSQAFVRAYRASYGDLPITVAALTYDAIGILIAAALRADSADSGPLREAIAETRDYEGVTGQLSFDDQGDPIKATAIVQIRDGTPRFRLWIGPEATTHHP